MRRLVPSGPNYGVRDTNPRSFMSVSKDGDVHTIPTVAFFVIVL